MEANFVKMGVSVAACIAAVGIVVAVNGLDPAGYRRIVSAFYPGGAAVPVSIPGRISSLATIDGVIQQKYPQIAHISPGKFDRLNRRGGQDEVILLDVREPDEFAVSHLAGARRIDPEASLESIVATAGSVSGKSVVFYCSVGARSAKLAQRMQDQLSALGARSVANLSGGIFRWHNEERSLVDAGGSTLLVHGYSAYWSQLVRRKGLISGKPQAGGASGGAAKAATEPAI